MARPDAFRYLMFMSMMLHAMNLSGFDLNHARALYFLLEEAHVARAAKRLGITPAAASNALRRLRSEFDDELLVRAGRGLCRTPYADQLRVAAREVLAAAERLLAVGTRFEPATHDGELDVMMSDRVSTLLSALDRIVSERAPLACLRIHPVPVDVETRLRDGGGCAIGPLRAVPGALEAEPLFDDCYVCVLRPGHPLLAGRWTARRYAAADHVLVAPRGSSDRGAVDDALEGLGLSRRVTRVVPTFALALPLVVGSDRIATLPESFARAYADSFGLVLRPPPIELAPIAMSLVWHARHGHDPRQVWLRALVRDAAAESRPRSRRRQVQGRARVA